MVDTISKDLDVDYMSDMYILEYLYNYHTKEELGISAWERSVLDSLIGRMEMWLN